MQKDSQIIIAIDGYSSTGKSTIAKQLAKHLGYIYVDTGAMYRAVALYAMQNGLVQNSKIDTNALLSQLSNIQLQFQFNPELGFSEMFLNGSNVEQEIRNLAVSNLVSKVAEISDVRKMLVKAQQEMGKDKGIVMDGRDIGTVVFPNAELKIFMNASASTRAERRYQELKSKNQNVTYEEVLQNVQERDYIDTHRKDSPLVIAKDAIELDNSNLDRETQFQFVLDLLKKI